MSKRNGRYYAALGGLVAATLLVSAAPSPEQRDKAPETQQTAHKQAGAREQQPMAPDPQITASEDVAQNKRADPDAQSKIEWGAWPDWVIVVFTAVLTVVTILQHRLEAKMARDTGDTIKTAKDSAEATKLMAQVQMAAMRAQVSPVDYQITQVSKAGDPAEAFLIRVGWLNSGATAAQNCVVQIAAEIIGQEGEIPQFSSAEGAPGRATVPPQLPFHSDYLHIMPEDIERVIRSEERLILWSRCDYNDVFEPTRTRVSEVCVQMDFMGNVADLLDGAENGNRYRFRWQPVGHQNYST